MKIIPIIGNDNVIKQRLAFILSEIDNDPEMPDLNFSFNQHYILVERLNFPGDIKICSFGFVTLEKRLFFNIDYGNFLDFDEVNQADRANTMHYGGGNQMRPFYNLDNWHIRNNQPQRDSYFASRIKMIYQEI